MNCYSIFPDGIVPIEDVYFYPHQAFLMKVQFEPEVFPGGEWSESFVSDYVVIADSFDAANNILKSAFRYSKFKVVSWFTLPNSTYIQHSIQNKKTQSQIFSNDGNL